MNAHNPTGRAGYRSPGRRGERVHAGHEHRDPPLPSDTPASLLDDAEFARLHREFEVAKERVVRLEARGVDGSLLTHAKLRMKEAIQASVARIREVEKLINA